MNNLAGEPRNDEVVSFDSEELVLVDQKDVEIGHLAKDKVHDGGGVLHRAFSLFIFNDEGKLLIQQRSAQKRLRPHYWSNSCCSHPRRGETIEDAMQRRLHQELGMHSELLYLYKFIYRAEFKDLGTEHELCWVHVGRSRDLVHANPNEVADWRFLSPDEVDQELIENADSYTPWMKLEWETIRQEYGGKLRSFF